MYSRPPTFSLFECFCTFCYLMRVPINDKCKHGIGGALLSNRISPLKDKTSNRFSRSRPKSPNVLQRAKGVRIIKYYKTQCLKITLKSPIFGSKLHVKNCGNYFCWKNRENITVLATLISRENHCIKNETFGWSSRIVWSGKWNCVCRPAAKLLAIHYADSNYPKYVSYMVLLCVLTQ